MSIDTRTRFRSDFIVRRAGQFEFAGYIGAGWKPPPHADEMIIDLEVGDRFPRIGHACWWTPVNDSGSESSAEQRLSWEGGPSAVR